MAADARDLPVGEVRAVLTVVGRGDLVFASLHRRPLLQHALAALEELLPGRVSVVADPADVRRTTTAAGHRSVSVLTPAEWRQGSNDRRGPVLVHDPLCPLVGPDFLQHVLDEGAKDPATIAVGVAADLLIRFTAVLSEPEGEGESPVDGRSRADV